MGQDTIEAAGEIQFAMRYEKIDDIELWWVACLHCGYGSAHVEQDKLDELTGWVTGHHCTVVNRGA